MTIKKAKTVSTKASKPVYNMDVIGRVDGFIPPKQARSEAVLQKILAAMAALIEHKTFDEITIPELAAHAGCGMAAIYSRFKDKNSILAALHETLRADTLSLDQILEQVRWAEQPLQDNIRFLVETMVRYYLSNRNLMKAFLLMQDEGCYRRAALHIQHIGRVLTERLQALMPGVKVDAETVDLGVRAVFALLQQRLIFHPVLVGNFPAEDEQKLCLQMEQVLSTFIQQAAPQH